MKTFSIHFRQLAKTTFLSMLIIIIFSSEATNLNACTTFFLKNGEQIVVGRNFDLSYGKYLIFANRRNVTKVGLQYPSESISSPAIWTSKYGSITFNMIGSDAPTDGMNEEGLVVSVLILDNSVYPDGDNLPSIVAEQWLQYLLDNCSTVDEVIEVSSRLKIRNNPFIEWELHFFITDNTGTCAAIEFIAGNVVVTTGASLEKKVLANSTYESSLQYFYNGRDPQQPMTSTWSRFYTAVEMTDAYNNEDIVDYSYSIMDAAEQSFTQRKIVYDISNRRIYLKSLENTQLRYFDMNTFDFSCMKPTIVYKETLSDVGNIRNLFAPLTAEINQTAVESGWNYMGVIYTQQELIDFSEIPVNYEAVFANAGDDETICIDNYEISANLPTYYKGKWSVISGSGTFDNSSATNTFIRQLGSGNNTVRWTLEGNSRTFYDDIIITNDKVEADAGEDLVVCENEFVLTGSIPKANELGTWQITDGSGIIQSSSTYNTLISELSNGVTELKWTVENINCEDSDLIQITNNSVTAYAGSDIEVCGTETSLNAIDPSPNSGSWKIVKGTAQIENTDLNNSQVDGLDLGENHFEWTVAEPSGCEATDIVIVTNNLVLADAGEDQTIENNSTYLSGNEPEKGIGTWSILEGEGIFSDKNESGAFAYDLGIGLNKFVWEITNNSCSDKDTVHITYNLSNSVFEPESKFSFNVFPNPASRFINFSFNNSQNIEFKVSIFNINGQVVYSKSYTAGSESPTHSIEISNLPKGTYNISIDTGTSIKSLKFQRI